MLQINNKVETVYFKVIVGHLAKKDCQCIFSDYEIPIEHGLS